MILYKAKPPAQNKAKQSAKKTGGQQIARYKSAATPTMNQGVGIRMLQSAPAALGAEMRTFMEFIPSPYRRKYRDAIRIRGREWIGPVIVPANAVAGQTLRNDFVAPQEFTDSRLAQFGQLYEKFLFQRLRWEYTPSVGSTQAGSVLLAYDRDISDPTPPPTTQGIRQFMSWEDTVEGNVWGPHACDAKLEQPETGFFTDASTGGDDRLAFQGQSYVALVDPCNNAAPLLIGNLSVVYEVDLFVPQLQTPIVSAQVITATAPAGPSFDALLPFVQGAAGFAASANSLASKLVPTKLPGETLATVKLVEGLYRMVTQYLQAGAGATGVAAPIIVPNEPAPAPAPQPQVRLMTSTPAAAATDYGAGEYLLDVPKGGARVSQVMSSISAATGIGVLELNRLGDYVADINSVF